ncbi:hypothetical protein FB599_1878 [Herbaspirillum sp. SJZ130]|nr:hypothetical protein [Herbaspirillum sp. SJZ102]TQK09508.1 hypothetical protein FB599_1878 [Herbaspirillum sp. SJZ130]TQK13805.1 hypothetical protein FB598_1164 [Herbaspirillum sp. SJZ106]TWC69525.1 hypothetical protein FB597_102128 [Herbaspirillum sp. SJZ099]
MRIRDYLYGSAHTSNLGAYGVRTTVKAAQDISF